MTLPALLFFLLLNKNILKFLLKINVLTFLYKIMCFLVTVINFDRNLTFKSADIGEVHSIFIYECFLQILFQ